MATKAKLERERQRLIEKYGDRVIVEIVDFYYPTFVIEGDRTEHSSVVATIRVSQVQIENTADLKEVERRLKEDGPVIKKWKFPDSEKEYFSPEEAERREELHRSYPPRIIKPAPDKTGEQSAPDSQDNRPAESPEEV